jgi:hypothetical protein
MLLHVVARVNSCGTLTELRAPCNDMNKHACLPGQAVAQQEECLRAATWVVSSHCWSHTET